MKHVLLITFLCIVSVGKSFGQKHVNHLEQTSFYFDRLIAEKNIAELNQFLVLMPKGGDLHHHYSGAIYVEDYLDIAQEKGLYINPRNFQVTEDSSHAITVHQLRTDALLYQKLLAKWSISNYTGLNTPLPSYQHFFSTFAYFDEVLLNQYRQQFKLLKQRALKENVQYIETILSSANIPNDYLQQHNSQLSSISKQRDSTLLNKLLKKITNKIDNKQLQQYVAKQKSLLSQAKQGIDDDNFDLRFQLYVFRVTNPLNVFTSMLACFNTANAIDDIVGVNIVGPEHEYFAMRDYWLHMKMFRFCKKIFPNVKTSLHAGELRKGLVKPECLNNHISHALNIAQADRIGHGVDIGYEKDAFQLLTFMANQKKAVEINLTSNEFILGIKGDDHPIKLYAKYQVPIVIGTDDAGVLRNDLTQEYFLLSTRYPFSYEQIKAFVFNSISFSFMNQREKKRQLNLLEQKFKWFEQSITTTMKLKCKRK